jgi:hypothetical protein
MNNKTLEQAFDDGELDRLAEGLFQSILVSAVLDGRIDPSGKTFEEFRQEAVKILVPIAKGKVQLHWIDDHTPNILEEARSFARQEKYTFSCLLYATYFEHWLNHTISVLGRRKNLSEGEITQIIRETQFRAKSTWLLRLLGFKRISEKHLSKMQSVVDLRNAFVHYKWKPYDPDDPVAEKEKELLKKILAEVEKTVRYLQSLHNRYLLHGKKRSFMSPKFKGRKKV